MQLAFAIYKYFPFGGIQRDLLKISTACLARGHSVRIYVIRWEAELPEEDGLDVHMVPVEAISNHRLYERFADYVLHHVKEHPVDLLIGMNKMPGLDVYYAGDSCYEEKARSQRNAVYRKLPRYRHFAKFERAVFDPLVKTRILTISDVQTPYFIRHYGTQRERFYPLPPGIERDRIAPEDKEQIRRSFRREFELAEDELLLLFIGSGFIKKGLDRVLRALKALPEPLYRRARLFVLGRDNAEPFKRMALRLGVAERVRFFTEGRNDVPRFLFAADGLLLPAYDENAGMVILEAMLAGLPALVTQNCGYARYLEEAGAGLLAPLPFEQTGFNDQLVELLTSGERDRWARQGMAVADREELFTLADTAADYLERFARERRPVIGFALFKYFPFGGLQRDFLKIAQVCQDRGYHVRAYVLSWEGPLPPGIDRVEVPVAAVTNHVRYRRFAEWVRRDVQWRPVSTLVGFNKMPGLDLYYAADSCYEEKARQLRAPLYRLTPRYRLFASFERAVFDPHSPVVIMLITDSQKAQFQKFYETPDHRLHLLPPGVSRDRQPGPDAERIRCEFRREFKLGDDEVLLLLIGSGFITKGVDRALMALGALPERVRRTVRFFVIGQDNPGRFLKLAEDLGVVDRLQIFSGRDDVARFLLGADIMVHPAYSESGGIVLLEALVAGLPVIATDVCGFAPFVERAGGGSLIPSPFSQEQLNRELVRYVTDPELRRRCGRNGIEFGRSADVFDMAERAADLIERSLGHTALSS
jgi:UDP-glucose:(heptosyl)LPS alpha-1,3-glucosyltransferase